MDENKIDDIINMLDAKTNDGVSRIKVNIEEEQEEGIKETKKYGRCDIDSKEC